MFDNMLSLDKQKLDRYQIWIDRCRHHGVEGWLTMRMNDCHGLQEYRQRMEEGTGDYRGWALRETSESSHSFHSGVSGSSSFAEVGRERF
ncbi:MAG: hypothetical protein WCP55_20890 [Lentisphaerota bacterium]